MLSWATIFPGVDPDARLVRRARRGDRRAFGELVERHRDRAWRVALGITGSPADAEDVTQEAFIAVLRHLHAFDGRSSFTTWLHRIVQRKALDHLRRRRDVPHDPAAHDPADPVDHQADHLVRQELLAAIADLGDGFRETFVLCELAGLSIREAAAVLEVREGTVKSRLHRARAELASALGTSGQRPASDSREGAAP